MIVNKKTFNLLYGIAQEIDNWEELETILREFNNFYSEINSEKPYFTEQELIDKIAMLKNGYGNPKPHHLDFSRTEFGLLLGITLETDEDEEPYDLNSENGVFTYVWNITDDWCSEYGYCFFENNIRIG